MNTVNMMKGLIVATMVALLVGCGAMKTAMTKQDLVVESQVTGPVVLEPVAPSKRIVYISVRDLTGNNMRRDTMQMLKKHLGTEGFYVTDDPDKANMMLNASVIQAKNTSKEEAYGYLTSGFEGALVGASTAAVLGADGRTTAGAGLAVAAVGFLADTMISDTYYTFVLDVQVRERPLEGDKTVSRSGSMQASGHATNTSAVASKRVSTVERGENFNWIVHETRIVTTANQMNLDINDAIPVVQERTAMTLTEMLL
ncbi:complement resistance protein TraT [Photobacterium sp. ZSDE20]|uniref:Complement resistance protein TraT n=1 Tax=Photobacterium pectinilyticum TaxID=2906793 RepID=A0ABT1N969_9GAMM|nr:complement resistance protein TraT [Photobacterium sp. ZSDE20]MCQ1061295.1 complement resistance protein TraT [Photobacterium sp. ZSDE20]MDD1829850.1 complement resistance protein TraT [Photobacterium sp. ZSDE20]